MSGTTFQNAIRFLSRPFVLRTFIVFIIFITLFHLSSPIQRHTDQYREKWGWKEPSHTANNENPSYSEKYDPPSSEPTNHSSPVHEVTQAKEELDDCPTFPGLDRIVITVKTGATEASHRVPVLLSTSLRCVPNVFVFSDMEEDIGDIHVYDALDTISESVKDHSDFDIYRKQYELKEKGIPIRNGLKGAKDISDDAAWNLDKYKNLHIAEKSWTLKPNMDWYLHIDADSYVIISSLMRWLQTLDPAELSYMGSVTMIGGFPFAHGGSGILVSGGATANLMARYNSTNTTLVDGWDTWARSECCGDFLLGKALADSEEMWVKDVNPTISGHNTPTVPFNTDHWCQPLVTLHHMSPDETALMGEFERQRKDQNEPLLYRELYEGFIAPRIPDTLDNWLNSAEDITVNATSMAECTAACEDEPKCLNYFYQAGYQGTECHLGTDKIMLGVDRREENGEETWTSMWNKTRIAEWIAQQDSCENIEWPGQ